MALIRTNLARNTYDLDNNNYGNYIFVLHAMKLLFIAVLAVSHLRPLQGQGPSTKIYQALGGLCRVW